MHGGYQEKWFPHQNISMSHCLVQKIPHRRYGPNTSLQVPFALDQKKTGWHLNEEKSTLEHVPFCLSGERVTTFQLAADPEFVKHCTIEKHSTGKGAAKHALGGKRARIV